MSDALALPEAALATYLEAQLPDFRGPLKATKFKSGQSNPTYLIEAASGRYVLRRKPPGKLLASAHAVDREFRVLGALHGGALPVATPLHLCRNENVIGSMFYVMSYVPGTVFMDPALPDATSQERALRYAAIVDVLVALTRIDVAATGLADFGKPGNYYARQIARWSEQYRASETERIEAMQTLIEWLPSAAPADDGRIALVHGDFRIDNLIWSLPAVPSLAATDGAPGFSPPRLAAVVDWELSTLGHPLSDFAYFCMALRLPRNPVLPGLAGLDRAALGIPDEAVLIDRFAAASGLDPRPQWPFLLALQFFRLAAIAQGVLKRALQGNASSDQALAAGRMTRTIAELGVMAANDGRH